MFSITMETMGCLLPQLILPTDWVPLNRPGAAEYLHLLYAVATPLLLLKVTPEHT